MRGWSSLSLDGSNTWSEDECKVPRADSNRAVKTLPDGLKLGRSSAMEVCGPGVFTHQPISEGTIFGPYEGVEVDAESVDPAKAGYMWEFLEKDTNVPLVRRRGVDAKDVSQANWLRYVQEAFSCESQNVEAFVYNGQMYYHAYKAIPAGRELMVSFDLNVYGARRKSSAGGNKQAADDKKQLYKCEPCGTVYNDEDVYKEHLKYSHPVKRETCPCDARYRCDQCDYATDHKWNFTDHRHTHTGERPYKCEQCEKGFTQGSSLMRHVRTVHDKCRDHKCDTCGQAFGQKGDLQAHMRLHTGSKPFVCAKCGEAFTKRGNMDVHVRLIHVAGSELVKVKCELCDKQFVEQRVLKQHMISAHNQTSEHHCGKCNRYFRSPGELRRHLLSKHGRHLLSKHGAK